MMILTRIGLTHQRRPVALNERVKREQAGRPNTLRVARWKWVKTAWAIYNRRGNPEGGSAIMNAQTEKRFHGHLCRQRQLWPRFARVTSIL